MGLTKMQSRRPVERVKFCLKKKGLVKEVKCWWMENKRNRSSNGGKLLSVIYTENLTRDWWCNSGSNGSDVGCIDRPCLQKIQI